MDRRSRPPSYGLNAGGTYGVAPNARGTLTRGTHEELFCIISPAEFVAIDAAESWRAVVLLYNK
jgi:hypothetical protein